MWRRVWIAVTKFVRDRGSPFEMPWLQEPSVSARPSRTDFFRESVDSRFHGRLCLARFCQRDRSVSFIVASCANCLRSGGRRNALCHCRSYADLPFGGQFSENRSFDDQQCVAVGRESGCGFIFSNGLFRPPPTRRASFAGDFLLACRWRMIVGVEPSQGGNDIFKPPSPHDLERFQT